MSIAVRTVFSCSLFSTPTLKSRDVTLIVNVALAVEFPLIVGLVAVNVAVYVPTFVGVPKTVFVAAS